MLAGLAVVGSCVADAAFAGWSVKLPEFAVHSRCVRASECVCLCVYLETALARWKAPNLLSVLTPAGQISCLRSFSVAFCSAPARHDFCSAATSFWTRHLRHCSTGMPTHSPPPPNPHSQHHRSPSPPQSQLIYGFPADGGQAETGVCVFGRPDSSLCRGFYFFY